MTSALSSTFASVERRWKGIHTKKSGRVILRVAKWTTIAVGGLWLLYIVVANAALQTRWARNKANADPQTLQVDYASAWTIIPGIVHLSKVTAYGQFTGLQYRGEIDHLGINVGVLALLRSRVVLDVHAKGVSLRGRPTHTTRPAAPVIDAPIALHEVEAPPVPVVDESLAKWTIEVDLEVTKGRELWVDAVRYSGPLAARASMSTTPNRSFAIQDFLLEIEGGSVLVGPKVALPHMFGRIDVKLDPVDPRVVDEGAFSRLTVATTIAGTVDDLSFVQDVAKVPVQFGGRGGDVGIQARLEHGHLVAPGLVKVSSGPVWFDIAKTGIAGQVDAEAVLDPSPDGPVAHLVARVANGALTNEKGTVMLTIPLTQSHATATHLDLADTPDMRFTFDAHAPRTLVPDATSLNALIDSPNVQVLKGKITGKADVVGDFPKGMLKGDMTFASDPIRIIAEGVTAQGKLAGKVPFDKASSESDFVLSGATARVDETSLDNGTSHTRDWWARASLPNGRIRLKGEPAYVGNIHSEFRDIDPVITAISKLHGVPDWVNKMLGIGPYTVDTIGTFGKHTKIEMVDARAKAQRFPSHPHTRVRATYDGTVDPSPWRAAIEFGVLALGLENLGKGLSIQLIDVNEWFDRSRPIR